MKRRFKNSVCGLIECDWCGEKRPRPRECPCPGNKDYKYVTDCTNSKCSRQLPLTTCTGYKCDKWNSCNENQGDCLPEKKEECAAKKERICTLNAPFDWRKENLCDFSHLKKKTHDQNSWCCDPEKEKENEPIKFLRWIGREIYDECKEQRNYSLRFTTNGLYGRGYNNYYSAVCGQPRYCWDYCQCDCCDLYGICQNDKY